MFDSEKFTILGSACNFKMILKSDKNIDNVFS